MERAELGRRLLASLGDAEAVKVKPLNGPVLIDEVDPRLFMSKFAATVADSGDVFLCNPQWSDLERAQIPISNPRSAVSVLGWLMIPTGGSSGQLKFARHDERTLEAAVNGFVGHFGLTRVNAIGVLPLYHVSGLMAWMRCALTGGIYIQWDWKSLEAGICPTLTPQDEGWVISLVPTQLERLLRQPVAIAWLRGFRIVFIGGAASRPKLLEQAAKLGLPLSLGYGMTETAAMVTALRPMDFLAGDRSCGQTLPHARVTVASDAGVGVDGNSLFRGYYPAWRKDGIFETADVGHFDDRGHLHIMGRRDDMIISGGEKIDLNEVTTTLRTSGQFSDLLVLGISDSEWGQKVVVAYPASDHPNMDLVAEAAGKLAAFKRPKRFVALPNWPLNEKGKLPRSEVVRQVRLQLGEN